MQLWPAIDIRGGRCVRLRQGDYASETEYGDPLEVASRYLEVGAKRLHVVDLDAARSGEAANAGTVVRIARRTGLPVQAGGGVRSLEAAAALLEGGVARVVVGTAALSEEGLLEAMLLRWPGRVVVGLDYRSARSAEGVVRREVAVRGWQEASGILLEEALERLAGRELAGIVVTDIARDGTGAGPDLAEYADVLGRSDRPLIASGGVSSAGDIARLARLEAAGRRLAGVVVGKALLAGSLTVAEAEQATLGLTN